MTLALHRPDGWLLVALMGLIAWLPVPIGSNDPLWIGLMEVAVFALLSSWMLLKGLAVESASTAPAGRDMSQWVIALLLLWLGYQVAQFLPLPLAVVDWLSPAAADIYRYALPDGSGRPLTLSLDLGLSLQEFLKSAAYVGLFTLVVALIDSRHRAKLLAYVLVAVVSLDAIWGILGLYGTPGGRAHGSYVNPNHFAGLLEIGIGLTLGLLLAAPLAKRRESHWRQRLSGLLQGVSGRSPRLYGYLILLLLFGALTLSASRGGILSLLIAMVVVLPLAALAGGEQGRELRLLRLAVAALLIGAVAFGANVLIERVDQGLLEAEGRRQTSIATLLMIQAYPAFGTGAGTWGTMYPMYKAPEAYALRATTNAHNDHLELLAEQGILGYVILGSAILIALWASLSGLQRRDRLVRGLSLGCTLAIVSLLMHAWVEFNFHVPANAAWFFVVLGLGLASSRLPDEQAPVALGR